METGHARPSNGNTNSQSHQYLVKHYWKEYSLRFGMGAHTS